MGEKRNFSDIFWFYCDGVPQFWQKLGPPSTIIPTLTSESILGVLLVRFKFCEMLEKPDSKKEGILIFPNHFVKISHPYLESRPPQ